MTRGEGTQSKVHFKGKNDDFIIFVDDVEAYNKWKSDSSVSLAQFISSFKIFLTHKYVLELFVAWVPRAMADLSI